ncbi:hypothetical protein BCR32DRAFT_329199 [Anaeromyces robustus]|jgi:Mg-chelatase subunit ChlD|uniref:VWFA domain-containing protein n=1 Tax=Anaeromyces robustus TaxID=1754192 RepID=A0A1Y1WU79_9FUNG|nr:hypothetical protein BCR32DRAFT_329199 [Anaeromyces robustus]|eukprot:ORX76786.1 hypothetical protein BCR32DRAFT_329199 [Anaeromyces robustus]
MSFNIFKKKVGSKTTRNVEFEELFGRYISEEKSNGLCKDSIHVCMKPKKVENTLPICLICVVDISGSMDSNCCNNVDGMESMYLSRLELVKHSIKTIVSTLRKDDMISVITFDDDSYLKIKPTILINKEKKDDVISKIDEITTKGCTNMWAGIKLAMNTSKSISYEEYQKSIMVFTDGYSNVNPPKGVYETLKDKLKSCKDKFTISTFSFGNNIKPKLLIDIANLCNGIYGYCPDGTMVGTIFINYMSNLLSTITPIVQVTITQGNDNKNTTVIGPLYRGIYRNAIFNIDKKLLNETKIIVELPMTGQKFEVPLNMDSPNLQTYIDEMSELDKKSNNTDIDHNDDDDDDDDDELLDKESDEETLKLEDIDTNGIIEEKDSKPIQYEEILLNQLMRDEFINILKKIVQTENLSSNNEENTKAIKSIKDYYDLLTSIKYKTKFIKDLMIDIDNPDPNHGQVEKAIRMEYYKTWGECYINSFLRFHQLEQCGNFKDQSLQYYGSDVFSTYRKMANTIFVNLPPPKTESRSYYRGSGNVRSSSQTFQMRNFINRHGGCFNGDAIVLLANGKTKYVKDLKKGDRLNNNAIVQCLIEQTSSSSSSSSDKNHLSKLYMCDIQGVLFTPYHPILMNNEWYFPNDLVESKEVSIHSWFNLILMDEENKKYEVEFSNGIKAITLGHYREENEVLKHPYFGTDLVLKDLQERDPIGYSQGYIFINEFNPRKLQFDKDNQYCINYYKVIPETETTIQSKTEDIKNIIVNNDFNKLVY